MSAKIQGFETMFSKRQFGWAGLAALFGCAICCAVPMLAAAGVGGSALALLSAVFRPGMELVVGAVTFVGVFSAMALRGRQNKPAACDTACQHDGACCGAGPKPSDSSALRTP